MHSLMKAEALLLLELLWGSRPPQESWHLRVQGLPCPPRTKWPPLGTCAPLQVLSTVSTRALGSHEDQAGHYCGQEPRWQFLGVNDPSGVLFTISAS